MIIKELYSEDDKKENLQAYIIAKFNLRILSNSIIK